MISKAEIEDFITAGEIKISYSFAPQNGDGFTYLGQEEHVDLSNPQSPATKLFQKNYFNDRLHVTLGPVIMSHHSLYGRKRRQFKDWERCTDIRESDNRILIYPRETISVNTNERITVKGQLGGLVLPRLKLADSGLLYTTSYIDPWWDGILQAVIVNATDSRQELHLGDRIATCFFFLVHGKVPEEIREEFQRTSHHYGQNWQGILERDDKPFPRVVKPVADQALQRIFHVVSRWLSKYKEWLAPVLLTSPVLLALLGSIYFAGQFYVRLSKLEKSEDKIISDIRDLDKEVHAKLPKLERQLGLLQGAMPLGGVLTIPIQSGWTASTGSVDVPWSPDRGATVWLQALDRPDDVASLEGRIKRTQSGGSGAQLTVEVALKRRIEAKQIRVKWLLIAQ